MPHKSLLIAVAAFAMTATGAQAYVSTKHLQRSGFNSEQVRAFTEARELQTKGEYQKARDLLVQAGVDDTSVGKLRQVAHGAHQAVAQAVEAGDFSAFKKAVVGSPIADIVTTEADFALFRQAHNAKQAGNWTQARQLFGELGLPAGMSRVQQANYGQERAFSSGWLSTLTPEEKDALRVARQANDTVAVSAILEAAGIEDWPRGKNWLKSKNNKL